MNPMQIINMFKNPKQTVLGVVKSGANPILNNLVNMAEKGDIKGVEQFARNIFKEQGRDFDKEINPLRDIFRK